MKFPRCSGIPLLIMALKEAHGGEAVWNDWEREIAARRREAVAVYGTPTDTANRRSLVPVGRDL